ncbi:cleavage and polyadenylation specificity factor subunit 6 [Melanotaenia boesemani]|uniref:cleavage and polyadenylation specificity factor subunit 6 n=1 Tax=Melanotaenia boesemani TaxID=1250792 RepID=UPI001C058FFC|nr:cleavage and polyadenylation specificity factor subunit 6 [Melanotaenia boesemani]
MWRVLILLAASLGVESYTVQDSYERLTHGSQLKIYLSVSAEKMEFISADNPTSTFVLWEKFRQRVSRGRVSGTGSDRRFYIDKVTYEDRGTYIQKNFWNKEISSVNVEVTPRQNYVKCVAGESLYISLEGVDQADANLFFSGPAANVTLVRDGARVSQDLPDYWDRVQANSMNIEIRHVNYSDEGQYTLRDRKDRVVSVTRMDLTDHHEYTSGSPLIALLLLLGIPTGICCCCRKKIFKKKAPTSATLQTSSEMVHVPPSGPVGPCPPYSSPGEPGLVNYYDPNSNMGPTVYPPPPNTGPAAGGGFPPSPGFNPAYPPPNPSYPPPGPAMAFPAQPQQWGYQPQDQYPPAPVGPMGYAPVTSSYPPPTEATESGQVMKREEKASSPADPLLTAAPQGGTAAEPGPPHFNAALSSSDGGAYQFQIDKNASNFL